MPYKLHLSLLMIDRSLHGLEQKITTKMSQAIGKTFIFKGRESSVVFLIVCTAIHLLLAWSLQLLYHYYFFPTAMLKALKESLHQRYLRKQLSSVFCVLKSN